MEGLGLLAILFIGGLAAYTHFLDKREQQLGLLIAWIAIPAFGILAALYKYLS